MDGKNKSKVFTDTIVWQKAHQFVLEVYKMTAQFPSNEIYGLTSQFRRAAVSIAANIAEGFAKMSNADKIRFYNMAQGSLNECKYYLILSKDLNYNSDTSLDQILEETGKLLHSYIKSIQNIN